MLIGWWCVFGCGYPDGIFAATNVRWLLKNHNFSLWLFHISLCLTAWHKSPALRALLIASALSRVHANISEETIHTSPYLKVVSLFTSLIVHLFTLTVHKPQTILQKWISMHQRSEGNDSGVSSTNVIHRRIWSSNVLIFRAFILFTHSVRATATRPWFFRLEFVWVRLKKKKPS